ncbi:hypothetical protein, partial [Candidatus Ichthyocystis hellenicum]|uniref:hypothetical protein n=1 Tax=Candidatus Ichthyocystis hellenicum TaxID=1561003 RepID=UPI001F5E4F4B
RPFAFTFVHGMWVSYFCVAIMDKMVKNCASGCIYESMGIILNRVVNSCRNCGDGNCFGDLLSHVDGEISAIVLEEFIKVMLNHWINKFTFLNRLFVWSDSESRLCVSIGNLGITQKILHHICVLVKSQINIDHPAIHKAVKDYAGKLESETSKDVKSSEGKGKYSAEDYDPKGAHSVIGKCSFNLINGEILARELIKLRTEKINLLRPIVFKEFYRIIMEGSLTRHDWSYISDDLFSTAVGASVEIMDNLFEGLEKIISRARVVGNGGMKRKMKRKEKVELTKNVMIASNRGLRDAVRRLWVKVCAKYNSLKLPSNMAETDKLKLVSIVGEFVLSFEPIIREVVNSMLSGMDTRSLSLDCISSKITPILRERMNSSFIEGGFYARVTSLLSESLMITPHGSRIATSWEADKIAKLAVRITSEGVDEFAAIYIGELVGSVTPASTDGSHHTVEADQRRGFSGEGDSNVAGPSGYSVAAGPSGGSVAAGISGSPDESSRSSLVIGKGKGKDKGKGKGKKRKIDDAPDVAFAGDRPDIVRSEYGSIPVSSGFNNDISGMVSEHLRYTFSVFEGIRVKLEEGNNYATYDEFLDDMRMQSREASANIISEFMDRVGEFVNNASVYDSDMKEREINEDEVSSFMNSLYGVITLRHNEILFCKMEELREKNRR